jgi:hypothetical protein
MANSIEQKSNNEQNLQKTWEQLKQELIDLSKKYEGVWDDETKIKIREKLDQIEK